MTILTRQNKMANTELRLSSENPYRNVRGSKEGDGMNDKTTNGVEAERQKCVCSHSGEAEIRACQLPCCKSIAHEILKKQGWTAGSGLGKNLQGTTKAPTLSQINGNLTGQLGDDPGPTGARRPLACELEETEEVEEQRREQVARERARQSSVGQLKSNFYCGLCDKQYLHQPEYDNHVSSYDHAHAKREKELKAATARKQLENSRRHDDKLAEKESKRLVQYAEARAERSGGVDASCTTVFFDDDTPNMPPLPVGVNITETVCPDSIPLPPEPTSRAVPTSTTPRKPSSTGSLSPGKEDASGVHTTISFKLPANKVSAPLPGQSIFNEEEESRRHLKFPRKKKPTPALSKKRPPSPLFVPKSAAEGVTAQHDDLADDSDRSRSGADDEPTEAEEADPLMLYGGPAVTAGAEEDTVLKARRNLQKMIFVAGSENLGGSKPSEDKAKMAAAAAKPNLLQFIQVTRRDVEGTLDWPAEMVLSTKQSPYLVYSCNPLKFDFGLLVGKPKSKADSVSKKKDKKKKKSKKHKRKKSKAVKEEEDKEEDDDEAEEKETVKKSSSQRKKKKRSKTKKKKNKKDSNSESEAEKPETEERETARSKEKSKSRKSRKKTRKSISSAKRVRKSSSSKRARTISLSKEAAVAAEDSSGNEAEEHSEKKSQKHAAAAAAATGTDTVHSSDKAAVKSQHQTTPKKIAAAQANSATVATKTTPKRAGKPAAKTSKDESGAESGTEGGVAPPAKSAQPSASKSGGKSNRKRSGSRMKGEGATEGKSAQSKGRKKKPVKKSAKSADGAGSSKASGGANASGAQQKKGSNKRATGNAGDTGEATKQKRAKMEADEDGGRVSDFEGARGKGQGGWETSSDSELEEVVKKETKVKKLVKKSNAANATSKQGSQGSQKAAGGSHKQSAVSGEASGRSRRDSEISGKRVGSSRHSSRSRSSSRDRSRSYSDDDSYYSYSSRSRSDSRSYDDYSDYYSTDYTSRSRSRSYTRSRSFSSSRSRSRSRSRSYSRGRRSRSRSYSRSGRNRRSYSRSSRSYSRSRSRHRSRSPLPPPHRRRELPPSPDPRFQHLKRQLPNNNPRLRQRLRKKKNFRPGPVNPPIGLDGSKIEPLMSKIIPRPGEKLPELKDDMMNKPPSPLMSANIKVNLLEGDRPRPLLTQEDQKRREKLIQDIAKRMEKEAEEAEKTIKDCTTTSKIPPLMPTEDIPIPAPHNSATIPLPPAGNRKQGAGRGKNAWFIGPVQPGSGASNIPLPATEKFQFIGPDDPLVFKSNKTPPPGGEKEKKEESFVIPADQANKYAALQAQVRRHIARQRGEVVSSSEDEQEEVDEPAQEGATGDAASEAAPEDGVEIITSPTTVIDEAAMLQLTPQLVQMPLGGMVLSSGCTPVMVSAAHSAMLAQAQQAHALQAQAQMMQVASTVPTSVYSSGVSIYQMAAQVQAAAQQQAVQAQLAAQLQHQQQLLQQQQLQMLSAGGQLIQTPHGLMRIAQPQMLTHAQMQQLQFQRVLAAQQQNAAMFMGGATRPMLLRIPRPTL